MALIRASAVGSGGGDVWHTKLINTSGNIPSWTGTPITPRKARLIMSYDSPAKICILSNIDPDTEIPSATQLWRSDDGENYVPYSSYSLVITNNSVGVTPQAWSSSNQGYVWEIAE